MARDTRLSELQEQDHGPEVTRLVTDEHARFRAWLDDVRHEHDPYRRREAFEALAKALVAHETAEQEAIYPVVAGIEGGAAVVDVARDEERALSRLQLSLLRHFQWRIRGGAIRHRLEELAERLQRHMAYEEEFVLPLLLLAEPEEKRQMMGAWLQEAKVLAPTRPHPHAPQRLAGLVTAGVAISMTDRLRDRLRRMVRATVQR